MEMIGMAEIRLTEKEIQAAVRILRSGALRQGKECAAFEQEFAQFVEVGEGKFLAVNADNIKHLRILESAGAWSYGDIL